MIPFKDITLADKDTITSFTMKSDRRNCDLSFSNLSFNSKSIALNSFLIQFGLLIMFMIIPPDILLVLCHTQHSITTQLLQGFPVGNNACPCGGCVDAVV